MGRAACWAEEKCASCLTLRHPCLWLLLCLGQWSDFSLVPHFPPLWSTWWSRTAMVSLGNPAFLPQTCEGTQCRQKRLPTAISFSLGLPSFPFGGAGASPPAFLALGLFPQVPPSSSSAKAHPLTKLTAAFLVVVYWKGQEQSHRGGTGWRFSTFPYQPSPASPRLTFLSLCTAASPSQNFGLFQSPLHKGGGI